jgi:DNA-binding NarL/FixJ family response regulator
MTISAFLADDHAILREGLARLLESDTQIRVVGTAGNGRDTITQVLKLKPQIAILDISMPDLNGIEAARQIHERAPEVRILILSMHFTAEHVFHALEAGIHGYILKESAVQEILDAVHAVQSGRRYLSPKVAGIVADQVTKRSNISPLDRLSKREREILQLVAEGRSSARIGEQLHLSPKTVDTYRSRLMQKLQLQDVTGLVKFAIQHGLISLD